MAFNSGFRHLLSPLFFIVALLEGNKKKKILETVLDTIGRWNTQFQSQTPKLYCSFFLFCTLVLESSKTTWLIFSYYHVVDMDYNQRVEQQMRFYSHDLKWTELICRNDFKFFQKSWINWFIMNLDAGTAHSSRERHSCKERDRYSKKGWHNVSL